MSRVERPYGDHPHTCEESSECAACDLAYWHSEAARLSTLIASCTPEPCAVHPSGHGPLSAEGFAYFRWHNLLFHKTPPFAKPRPWRITRWLAMQNGEIAMNETVGPTLSIGREYLWRIAQGVEDPQAVAKLGLAALGVDYDAEHERIKAQHALDGCACAGELHV